MKLPVPNLLSFSGKSTNDRPSKKARRAGKSQRYKYPPRLEIQWKKTKVEMRGSRNRKPRPVSISRSSCRVELNPPLSGSRQQPYLNLTMINFDISRILNPEDQNIPKFPHLPKPTLASSKSPIKTSRHIMQKDGESLQWRPLTAPCH